jgi:hypothetical protein
VKPIRLLGTDERVSITYKNLADDVKPGDHILIDDGLVGLEVVEIKPVAKPVNTKVNARDIVCKVLNDGVDTICGIWGVLGILFIIAKIGDITIMFNDDALGSIAEEHEKEKRVLEGVLGISQSIQTESVKSGELIEKLVGVTESVTNSMQEISASANTTAGSIEEQSTMTNSIQDAIGVTGDSQDERNR